MKAERSLANNPIAVVVGALYSLRFLRASPTKADATQTKRTKLDNFVIALFINAAEQDCLYH